MDMEERTADDKARQRLARAADGVDMVSRLFEEMMRLRLRIEGLERNYGIYSVRPHDLGPGFDRYFKKV